MTRSTTGLLVNVRSPNRVISPQEESGEDWKLVSAGADGQFFKVVWKAVLPGGSVFYRHIYYEPRYGRKLFTSDYQVPIQESRWDKLWHMIARLGD